MRKRAFFPYLRAPSACVVAGRWDIVSGDTRKPLGAFMPGWDCNSRIVAERQLTVDVAEIREHCRLPSADSLMAVVIWISTGTGLRGVCSPKVDLNASQGEQNHILRVDLEGHQLAVELCLETQIVLEHDGQSTHPLAAKRAGSILWEDESSVVLEGRAARFPVEVIDFSATSWTPSEGAWFLDWGRENLYQSVLGGLRLYVNASHPKMVKALTSESPDPEDSAIHSAIRYDVGRTLICGALANSEFTEDPHAFGEGTIGTAIRRLIQTVFHGETPEALSSRMKERPAEFESRLQAGLRLFRD